MVLSATIAKKSNGERACVYRETSSACSESDVTRPSDRRHRAQVINAVYTNYHCYPIAGAEIYHTTEPIAEV